MKISLGRIVHYRLTVEDAHQINRRRTTGESISRRMRPDWSLDEDKECAHGWPRGAQAHIGREVGARQEFPMIVVRITVLGAVCGQVFLDGTDVLWVQDVIEGTACGTWHWPEKVE